MSSGFLGTFRPNCQSAQTGGKWGVTVVFFIFNFSPRWIIETMHQKIDSKNPWNSQCLKLFLPRICLFLESHHPSSKLIICQNGENKNPISSSTCELLWPRRLRFIHSKTARGCLCAHFWTFWAFLVCRVWKPVSKGIFSKNMSDGSPYKAKKVGIFGAPLHISLFNKKGGFHIWLPNQAPRLGWGQTDISSQGGRSSIWTLFLQTARLNGWKLQEGMLIPTPWKPLKLEATLLIWSQLFSLSNADKNLFFQTFLWFLHQQLRTINFGVSILYKSGKCS